ncbi:hypothetical protein Xen7305DRAFT_00028530 [Xenococcus sp. PCC 7305]|uniref:DUF4760 domain-containing protein n=1 Tax=Xenococcus sp. PCC 7305 TaxID=102125 RepID=UPI0002AC1862|nr:DUF4760 domain-containing protein [Xenococcus sp. PCC 7305]ELS03133.1 hypothetical protein Xen7305DRAFT_00028530 [Xenococcus sp. PCC 7305]
MPEIKEKIEQKIFDLEQEETELEIEKLSLQHHSVKLQAIGLLTIFLIAGSLIIQAFAILERNTLNREKNALNLISEYSEVFTQEKNNSISQIISFDEEKNDDNNSCLKFIGQQSNPISQDVINDSCPPEIDVIKTESNILSTLNFLEIMALSYKNNIADRKMIEDYFKSPAISQITKLETFIQEVDQNSGNKNWKNIEDLVEKWKK